MKIDDIILLLQPTLAEIETKNKHISLRLGFTRIIVVELVFVIIKFSSVKLNGSIKKNVYKLDSNSVLKNSALKRFEFTLGAVFIPICIII